MPDEQPPIPPPQAYHPSGVVTAKRKRWIVAGVIGGAFLLLLFSLKTSVTTSQRTPEKPIVRTEPSQLTPDPPQPRVKPAVLAPPVETQMPVASPGYLPQSSIEPDRSRDERRQREEKAAYESSVIVRPKPETTPRVEQEPKPIETAAPPAKQATNFVRAGTFISCSLVNALNGSYAGPVVAQVSTPVYDSVTWREVIPQGARILGDAGKVGGFGEERLAVMFHRVTWTGHDLSLDKAPGLDQEGATALKDRVDNHWRQIFGASLAIGAIGGVAQIGNSYSGYGYSPDVAMRNGITQSMGQSAYQILDRFLQKPPTIQIRSGQRVVIYVRDDIPVPEDETVQAENR